MKYKIYALHEGIDSETVPDGFNMKRIKRMNLEDIFQYESYDSIMEAEKELKKHVESVGSSEQFTILPVYQARYDVESKSYKLEDNE